MNSRMEKYYKNDDIPKRSVKNKDLYDSIYDDVNYNEINIVPKERVVDINELREIINSSPKKVERKKVEIPTFDDDSYDLNDALDKARNNKVDDLKRRSISNTEYDILKNVKIKKDSKSLEDLINTVSTKNLLSDDLDLFDNLKSVDNTTVGIPSYDDIEKTKMDDSFFTKSMKLGPSDFENINNGLEKNNKMMKMIFILIIVLIAIVLGIIVFLII